MSPENTARVLTPPRTQSDYSLTGVNAALAIEKGLAEADWYQCPVPRSTMRRLLERRDGPALRDTVLWFALIIGSGYWAFVLWGSWWAMIPFALYGALYASTSDSRWHESGHGTAFRTDWMNSALYEVASFMVMRESVVWRWSHVRHHSDTIIVGRDPEIAVPRPPNVFRILSGFFNLRVYIHYFPQIISHAVGRISLEEKSYIPLSEFPKIRRRAQLYLGIYAGVTALCVHSHSILPLMFVGLTNLYGSWLMTIYGTTQHAGLAENVLDHRLNCRTIYMGQINRFLYWNMNYHVEHHMYPLVPYHALPQLHQLVKDDMPEAYPSLFSAWREILPTVLRQIKDPAFHIKRKLPQKKSALSGVIRASEAAPDSDGWIEVCAAEELQVACAIRFDHERRTFALYRTDDGRLYATDGVCTHGNTHLSEGFVKGRIIECPKHNGRFDLKDGSAVRAPACRGLATHPVRERGGRILLGITSPGGTGTRTQQTHRLRLVSNRSVATFIKELVFETANPRETISFTPGDYLQIDIPAYERIRFRDFDIPQPYAEVWERQHMFDLSSSNPSSRRRNNYSLACNLEREKVLRFNVRIATPPPGQDCAPGVGSSYLFSLKVGAEVTAIGPFGDFHIKPTQREMVYIGGGAGMAPLRAHLSHLFETEKTARKISFWYGARSRQEIYYEDYFIALANLHANFTFRVGLSSPLPEDRWTGDIGFIHEVAGERYLRTHPNPTSVEYYLCGPPMMIKACTRMLSELGVRPAQVAFDEF